MTSFVEAHKEGFGVEPICRTLQFAPATYYAAVSRPASARAQRDEELKVEVQRVWTENRGVYGADKVWAGRHPGGALHRRAPDARLGNPWRRPWQDRAHDVA